MSVTLLADATTYTLPDDLLWTDEYSWLPTAQQVDVALNGSLIIEESAQAAGRPTTLSGGVNYAWIERGDLDDLRTLAATPRDTAMVLTLADGRSFDVLFRHGSQPAVEASPLVPFNASESSDRYAVTLRFLQV